MLEFRTYLELDFGNSSQWWHRWVQLEHWSLGLAPVFIASPQRQPRLMRGKWGGVRGEIPGVKLQSLEMSTLGSHCSERVSLGWLVD
jgi:hypothetical protein